MHRWAEVLDKDDIKDVVAVLCVRNRGGRVRPKDQVGVSVGVITQQRNPVCGQPGIPIRVLRVDMSRGKPLRASLVCFPTLRV
jgi:hypothetical protein